MTSSFHALSSTTSSALNAHDFQPCWYALHTRARHEKHIANRLQSEGISTFLPLVNELHRWSDRNKVVQVPLFSCYVFANVALSPELHAKVLMVDGVLRFVGPRGEATPVAEGEIENVRTLLKSATRFSICPFLNIGQRVRVRGGSLDGIEGILVSRNGDRTLVISVEPIQRSLAVSIDYYDIEPA